MRVHLGGLTGRNPRLQYADGVVLEQDAMRLGGCSQRIE